MAKVKTTIAPKIPVNETKEARFVRVVTPRIIRAGKAIKLIGYCSSTNYAFTPEQVKQISDELQTAIEVVIDKYNASPQSAPAFEFTE